MLASFALCFLPAEGFTSKLLFLFLPPKRLKTGSSGSAWSDTSYPPRVGRAASNPLAGFKVHGLCLSSQQAWPTGTQQILIPSSWQQLPGVAIHSSAHQSAVAESPLETHEGSSQQGHIWRSVDSISGGVEMKVQVKKFGVKSLKMSSTLQIHVKHVK